MQPTIWEWPKQHRATVSSSFDLVPSNLQSVSPYTQVRTAYGQTKMFQAKLTFPTMKAEHWRPIKAFISRLDGISGLVRMVDYNRMKPYYDEFVVDPTTQNWSDGHTFTDGSSWVSGYLPPFVVVDEAADEGADSVVLRGYPASLSAVTMGDLGEHRPNGVPTSHSSLYETQADGKTNASGKTRVYISPGLRKGVAAGDMWVLRYPTGVFELASDTEGSIQRGLANLGNFGLTLNEKLPWQ